MKHIKLFEEFLNERLSMEAVYIHQITGCGQDSAQNFIDDNNIDGKKLADYVKHYKDSKEKYQVRDMINGTNKNKRFLSQFVNESKAKFSDQLTGNDQLVFKKSKEWMNGDRLCGKYDIYWRGYEIDGNIVFSSVYNLERFMKNYVLSNNLYNKYKHMPEKSIGESEINESSLVDYSKSKNKILVGLKTDLLRNMKDRYVSKEDGDNIHFFDKGKHIGTLFDLGSRYQELRHDGTIDDKGYRINEDLDATVSDPEVEEAWVKIYGHSLKHDHASIFKILKQRPPLDSKELDRIWSEAFDKTFKEQHPRVWDILFSDKDKTN